jgi:hypothetical protein
MHHCARLSSACIAALSTPIKAGAQVNGTRPKSAPTEGTDQASIEVPRDRDGRCTVSYSTTWLRASGNRRIRSGTEGRYDGCEVKAMLAGVDEADRPDFLRQLVAGKHWYAPLAVHDRVQRGALGFR